MDQQKKFHGADPVLCLVHVQDWTDYGHKNRPEMLENIFRELLKNLHIVNPSLPLQFTVEMLCISNGSRGLNS